MDHNGWNNQNGHTLIEILASFAIAFLLIAAAGNLYLTVNTKYNKINESYVSKAVAENINSYMIKILTYASDLEISYMNKPEIENYNYVITLPEDGKILVNGSDPYGDLFYGNKTINWNFEVEAKETYILLNLIIKENKKNLYKTDEIIYPINLPVKNRTITIGTNDILNNQIQTIYIYLQLDKLPKLEED